MNTTERQARYDHILQRAVETRLATISRRSLVRGAAVAGGAAIALGPAGLARVAAQGTTQMAQEAPFNGPIDVLNYALTLEHLEATFYSEGLAKIGQQGITSLGFLPGVFDYLGEIGAQEAAHVTTLTEVITQLGGMPVEAQTYDFGYSDAAGFLSVAQALEDTGVAAYQGAAQYLIENDDLLTAALTIHGVEARHAAYLAILNAKNPYPEAVNPALAPSEVLEIAGPFIQQ